MVPSHVRQKLAEMKTHATLAEFHAASREVPAFQFATDSTNANHTWSCVGMLCVFFCELEHFSQQRNCQQTKAN